MVRQRVRIRFGKQGNLRLIGHRDLVRTLERLFRRADLRLGMSQGFHPKPRMSFPSALAVGIEGLDEVMELELAQSYPADELLELLRHHSVPGLTFRSVELLPAAAKKGRLHSVTYQVPVPADRRGRTAAGISRLMACRSYQIQRPGRRTPIDLRPLLEALTLSDGVLSMRFRVTHQAGPGPRDVLRALDLGELEQKGICLRRTAMELHS